MDFYMGSSLFAAGAIFGILFVYCAVVVLVIVAKRITLAEINASNNLEIGKNGLNGKNGHQVPGGGSSEPISGPRSDSEGGGALPPPMPKMADKAQGRPRRSCRFCDRTRLFLGKLTD